MRRIRRLIDNEHGVALVLALMILLTLTGLVLAFLSASAFEPQISRNHSETVRARYVAEAGVEYAYDTLATNVGSWNDYLAAATCAQGAVLGAPNSSLPGLGHEFHIWERGANHEQGVASLEGLLGRTGSQQPN